MNSLNGRVVVLTGAAGGIGSAIARRLSADGARLVLVDRNTDGLTALAASLAPAPVTCRVVDLSQLDQLDALAQDITAEHGAVHVLINNAGLTVHGLLADQTPEEIDRVLDVDLRAPLHLTRAFLPALRATAPAHVVNIASMAGLQGFPFQTTYSAAKFALRGFGQALRPELASHGVGVSTILPGTIATDFLAAAGTHDPQTSQRLAGLMQRYGTPPSRVASAVRSAILRDRAEVRVGWDCTLLALAAWLCPPLTPAILSLALRRGWLGATT